MEDLSQLQRISAWILPVIFAITVHEVAHGWVAKKLGDPTAQRLGRLTLNPLKHIDPIGTILVPGLLLLLGGFVFGWAKPVPVTWENLKHPKRDMALVAAAGPGANFIMAILWGMVAKMGMFSFTDMQWAAQPMVAMGLAGVAINVVLMVLNLLPLPPLDGGRVLAGLLPGPWAWQLNRIEPYGFFILLVLMVSGLLGRIIGPPLIMVQNLVFSLLGVS